MHAVRSRRMLLWASLVILLLLGGLLRVTDDEVRLYRMKSFQQEVPDSEIKLTDGRDVASFTYAVRFASKQQGTVDIVAPPYRFRLGQRDYFLWIHPDREYGSIMRSDNTNTLYRLRSFSVSHLKEILRKYEKGADES